MSAAVPHAAIAPPSDRMSRVGRLPGARRACGWPGPAGPGRASRVTVGPRLAWALPVPIFLIESWQVLRCKGAVLSI